MVDDSGRDPNHSRGLCKADQLQPAARTRDRQKIAGGGDPNPDQPSTSVTVAEIRVPPLMQVETKSPCNSLPGHCWTPDAPQNMRSVEDGHAL